MNSQPCVSSTSRKFLGVVMAAVVSPGHASFDPSLQLPNTRSLSSEQETSRLPCTKTLHGLADEPDGRFVFSKTWTGSTRAPDEADLCERFSDADSDDDRSPWASAANGFGDLSFCSDTFGDGCEHQVQLDRKLADDLLPSEGSKLHATGECKPCTWFWKASGCQNGRECMHCHLCPKSEAKLRKKDKVRAKKAIAVGSCEQAEEPSTWQQQQQPHVVPQLVVPQFVQEFMVPFRPPPGLPHPPPSVSTLITPPGLGCPLGMPDAKEQILFQSDDESTADGLSQQADGSFTSAPSSPSSEDLCSVGSHLHAAGECKPCSWFWKPQGCKNGKDCLHCHLCAEGEVRRKKKAKAGNVRKLNAAQSEDAESKDMMKGVDEVANSFQLQTLMVQQQMLIQQQQHQLLHMQLQMGMQQQQMQLSRLPGL